MPARVSAARLGRWEWGDTHHEERGRDGEGNASVDELSVGFQNKDVQEKQRKMSQNGLADRIPYWSVRPKDLHKKRQAQRWSPTRTRDQAEAYAEKEELEAQHTVAYAPVGKPSCFVADGQHDRANKGRAR